MNEGPGYVGGKHFSEWPDAVKALKRAGKIEHAERLLLALADATEEVADTDGGVAPWPYEQLAIIYAQRKDAEAEIAILERYAAQKHAPGVSPKKLAERLEKARAKKGASG